MDFKFLLGILNRPWMIEPTQAEYWGNVASDFLAGRIAGVPNKDTRNMGGGYYFPRVDKDGNISNNGPVQVIKLDGPIGKHDFCGSPGSQSMQQAVRAANQDNTVESIVLWIDSPGGQVDGTDNLAQEALKMNNLPAQIDERLLARFLIYLADHNGSLVHLSMELPPGQNPCSYYHARSDYTRTPLQFPA